MQQSIHSLIDSSSTEHLLYLEHCIQLLQVAASFQTTIWPYFEFNAESQKVGKGKK